MCLTSSQDFSSKIISLASKIKLNILENVNENSNPWKRIHFHLKQKTTKSTHKLNVESKIHTYTNTKKEND